MPILQDTGLRRAFNAAIGILEPSAPGEFSLEKLAKLTRLSWSDEAEAEAYPKLWKPIERLDGLEHATGLVEIGVNGNHIADLRPLAACLALEEAWLGGNDIRDLRPLAALPKLRRLSLFSNAALSDISPLAEARSLQILDLTGTAVQDFAALLAVPTLNELRVGRSYGASTLPDPAIEQLGALGARGVSIRAGADQDRVKQAIGRRKLKPTAVSDPIDALLREGQRADLALLWQRGGIQADDDNGQTLLHLAVITTPALPDPVAWRCRLIRALGQAGARAERADDTLQRNSPLTLAVDPKVPGPVFDALLEIVKDVDYPPHRTPLADLLDGSRRASTPELERRVGALLSRGANPANPSTLLAAIRAGRAELVEAALARGPALDRPDKDGNTPLSTAAKRDDIAQMTRLLDAGADPATGLDGARSAEALRLLATRGADLNGIGNPTLRTRFLHSLSWWALGSAFPWERVEAFLRAAHALGAELNARNWQGRTPMMALVERTPYDPAEKERLSQIIALLGELGANPALTDADDKTAAQLTRDSEVRAALRRLKSPKDAEPRGPLDSQGKSPLHRALEEKDPELRRARVMALVAEGADISARDWSGKSPLSIWLLQSDKHDPDRATFDALLCPSAAEDALSWMNYRLSGSRGVERFRPMLDAMLAAGIQLSKPVNFLAILRTGQVDLVERALAEGASLRPERPGDRDAHPLIVAIRAGHPEVVDLLLAAGADPDGDPLHNVIPLLETFNLTILRSLLKAGADPNRRGSYDGRTPLHHLAQAAHLAPEELTRAFELLLEAGADGQRRDSRGLTVADVLAQRKSPVKLP